MMNKKFILSILVLGVLLLNVVQIHAQQNQNEETRIEIKINGEINETQKAKINDLLNYFENQNPRLKIDSKVKRKGAEREKTPFDKYPFIIPATIIVIIFAIGFWLLTKFYQKQKFTTTMITSIIFLALLIFSGASGFWLLFFKEIKIQFLGHDLKYWHILGSYLMVFFALIHFSQSCLLIHHTKVMIKNFFNMFKRNKNNTPKP